MRRRGAGGISLGYPMTILLQATQESARSGGMATWTAGDWVIFFGALGTFLGITLFPGILAIIKANKAQADVQTVSRLSVNMAQNQIDSNSVKSPDPALVSPVHDIVTGTGDGTKT